MRFMILLKADQDTEAGKMPSEQLLGEMMAFNQQLVDAGVMLGGEGLQPTAKGARVSFAEGKTSVSEGPFPLTGEQLAGFWLWQCASKEEAIEWVRKVPMPMASGKAEIEIRQLFDAADFGDEFTPEMREQEEKMRAQVAARQ
ncbi:MAG TPA: YciI family protein [Telluria sp.]|nr:YciI family protein [Telluria sp.]